MSWLNMSEPVIRLVAFGSIFVCLAVLELALPRLERAELAGALKMRRWTTNLMIVILSSVLLRIVFPLAAVGTALWASTHGYGLFPLLGIPAWLAGIIGFVALDFAVWLEHVASHKIPWFWRIHRMHHSDPGVDLTTALRFHPLEIVISMLWKAGVVIVLGLPPVAVLIFEIVLNGAAMFNHANLNLSGRADRILRLAIVTPDMHRIHHSIDRRETDSNYGFNLSFWDRIFATYTEEPARGADNIETGLQGCPGNEATRLVSSLTLPFREPPGSKR